MAAEIEIANTEQGRTVWQKLAAWLTAFEQALDYDPQEYANARIAYLGAEIRKLTARLEAVEGDNQRAA